jgi:secretion/DNA translocation related TadE-like protein
MSRGRNDTGSATVWVVTAMALVLGVGGVSGSVGVVTVERHRADTAADAAALAAAGHVIAGQAAACKAAAETARADGAELSRCGLYGAGAQVETRVALPGVLGRFGHAVSRARAGP